MSNNTDQTDPVDRAEIVASLRDAILNSWDMLADPKSAVADELADWGLGLGKEGQTLYHEAMAEAAEDWQQCQEEAGATPLSPEERRQAYKDTESGD